MTLERAEAVLTDPSLTDEVDTIVRRHNDGYRAASADGAVEFRRTDDGEIEVTAATGHHPLRNDATDDRLDVATEQADPWARLGGHATPYAMDSVAQYFDAPHAPDVVVLHAPTHRFHGNAGEHGSLAVTQARAPFIAAGPGIVARGIVDEHLRAVDVAPTLAALLGWCTDRRARRTGQPPVGSPTRGPGRNRTLRTARSLDPARPRGRVSLGRLQPPGPPRRCGEGRRAAGRGADRAGGRRIGKGCSPASRPQRWPTT